MIRVMTIEKTRQARRGLPGDRGNWRTGLGAVAQGFWECRKHHHGVRIGPLCAISK